MQAQERTLHFSGMHCDACEKTITRALGQIGVEVVSINHVTGEARIRFDEQKNTFAAIEKAVSDAGYEVRGAERSNKNSEDPVVGFGARFTKAFKEFRSSASAFQLEKRILKESIGTLVVVFACMYLVYLVLFWNIEGFWSRYGFYMIFLSLAVVASAVAVRHLRAYRASVSCMSGMMIGMTIGMISSMLIGASVGATNGMFAGAVFSMAIGMGFGAWVGASCGVMGVMEGMMAGLMGGTMGPMISVMMISDHLKEFFPIFFVACFMILAGLMYMVQKENRSRNVTVRPYPFWTFSLITFGVVFLGSVIMVWGPRASFLVR
jgi:cation transport ATPase